MIRTDPRTAHFERAEGYTVPGQFLARGVDDLHFHPVDGPPDAQALRPLLLAAQRVEIRAR